MTRLSGTWIDFCNLTTASHVIPRQQITTRQLQLGSNIARVNTASTCVPPIGWNIIKWSRSCYRTGLSTINVRYTSFTDHVLPHWAKCMDRQLYVRCVGSLSSLYRTIWNGPFGLLCCIAYISWRQWPRKLQFRQRHVWLLGRSALFSGGSVILLSASFWKLMSRQGRRKLNHNNEAHQMTISWAELIRRQALEALGTTKVVYLTASNRPLFRLLS